VAEATQAMISWELGVQWALAGQWEAREVL